MVGSGYVLTTGSWTRSLSRTSISCPKSMNLWPTSRGLCIFVVRSAVRLSSVEGKERGYPEDNIQSSLRSLWILSHALQSNQCPSSFYRSDELVFSHLIWTSSSWSLSMIFLYIFRERQRACRIPENCITDPPLGTTTCQVEQVWVLLKEYSILVSYGSERRNLYRPHQNLGSERLVSSKDNNKNQKLYQTSWML